jgi:hypothetical protein
MAAKTSLAILVMMMILDASSGGGDNESLDFLSFKLENSKSYDDDDDGCDESKKTREGCLY